MSVFNHYHSPFAQPGWSQHVCGLYYTVPSGHRLEKYYLPQVEIEAHATILSTTSRTVLTQTFANPSENKGIKEVKYTFPLYDGVSVVGFTCHVGDRVIVGEVKEKEKARAVFKEAVARGETAGLFEQLPDASDVFTTTIGNVPPGAKVIVKITYLGELKHDMEIDGIRFTIPTIICPRYGKYPLGLTSNSDITNAAGKGISIIVDAEMAEGSFIQQIRSPSHPIAISMGTTSFAPRAEPSMSKASATLSLGSAQLDTDFVLQIVAKDTGVPKAILETHPTIPNHRALLTTLVPKFALPPEKPEIVFVCDRSGSMSGSRIVLVRQALKVFLKSLPVGVKFNICSFGDTCTFLWPKSATYSQQTLDEAIRHVDTIEANYGGTEMIQPMRVTIEQRYKDIPLEVMMLTDGEIWNQQQLFSLLNKEVQETKAPIRVFTLGIGNGVSHSLIEGVAKAGNGFSQTVGEGEKMDSKVVRMLKGALSPHIDDYTLEVKYSDKQTAEDDFEIIEKVADSLTIKLDLKDVQEKQQPKKKPISLFNLSVNPDVDEPAPKDETGESRYAHLPTIATPKIIQAPQNIPTLFAFNRTSVYLLLGPEAPRMTPKSVILRGTSVHGPLELEIPVQVLDTPGETIHQLAAKKAIVELEQGRGWLAEARDQSGTLIKEKFESRFDDMVEREAVRLGVQFQTGGKWCSFVAVEKKKKVEEGVDEEMGEDYEWLDDETHTPPERDMDKAVLVAQQQQQQVQQQAQQQHQLQQQQQQQQKGGLFGGTYQPAMYSAVPTVHDSTRKSVSMSSGGSSLFGFGGSSNPPLGPMNQALPPPPPVPGTFFGAGSAASPFQSGGGGLFGSTSSIQSQAQSPLPPQFTGFQAAPQTQGNITPLQDYQMQLMLLEQQNKNRKLMVRQAPAAPVVQAAALQPPEVEVDQAILEQYQKEMEEAACMPLADEEFEEEVLSALSAPPPPARQTTSVAGFSSEHSSPAASGTTNPLTSPSPPQGVSESMDRLRAAPVSPFGNSNGSGGSTGGFGSASAFGSVSAFGSTSAFGAPPPPPPPPPQASNTSTSLFGGAPTSPFGNSGGFGSSTGGFGSASAFGSVSAFGSTSAFGAPPPHPAPAAAPSPFAAKPKAAPPTKPLSDDDILDTLIGLQTFEGYWSWTSSLFTTLSVSETEAQKLANEQSIEKQVLATALVIAFLERKLAAKKQVWDLVVEKARAWLGSEWLANTWSGEGVPKAENPAVVVVEQAGRLLK